MAEFSRQYFEYQDLPYLGDFSYLELCETLIEGELLYHVCEGFGTLGVVVEGVPCLIVDFEGTISPHDLFISGFE